MCTYRIASISEGTTDNILSLQLSCLISTQADTYKFDTKPSSTSNKDCHYLGLEF